MTKRIYYSIAALILIALTFLLIYSLDRTSWLLTQYELNQADTLAAWLGLSPLALGSTSALVIEVGLIALMAGEVLSSAHPDIKRYAIGGLIVGLAVQALANLLAGYLRGFQAVLDTLIAHGANANFAWYVAGLAWFLSSVSVPALIFILSRLAALVIRLGLSAPIAADKQRSEPLPERSSATEQIEVPRDVAAIPALTTEPPDETDLISREEFDNLLTQLRAMDDPRKRLDEDTLALQKMLLDEALEPQAPMTMLDLERLTADVLPGDALAIANGHRYECPHCGAPVKNKQALGAAHKNGYCLNCKTRQAV